MEAYIFLGALLQWLANDSPIQLQSHFLFKCMRVLRCLKMTNYLTPLSFDVLFFHQYSDNTSLCLFRNTGQKRRITQSFLFCARCCVGGKCFTLCLQVCVCVRLRVRVCACTHTLVHTRVCVSAYLWHIFSDLTMQPAAIVKLGHASNLEVNLYHVFWNTKTQIQGIFGASLQKVRISSLRHKHTGDLKSL